MTINEYQKLAMTTLNKELSKKDVLINAVMGLCGESGEAIDIVKKHLHQGHELAKDKLIKELGDIAWYLAEAAYAIDMDLESILALNIEKLKQNIRKAASSGAELIVLQELHNGLYFCQIEDPSYFDLSESIPGPSTTEFGSLAKELGVVLVLSLFERAMAGLYFNTAVVIEKDGSIAGKYRKMHIPDDPAYYEKFYFTVLVERRVTSWAPPSTMETEETRVSLASRCRSGMVMTPQLHMVDLTLYREASTLSCRGPA